MTDQSPLVGKTLEELHLRGTSGANIVAIERNRRLSRKSCARPRRPSCRPATSCSSICSRQTATSTALRQEFALEEMPLSGAYFTDRSQEIGMAEVIVPANSDLVGKTVVEAEFRTRFGLTVIGLRRGSVAQRAAACMNEG